MEKRFLQVDKTGRGICSVLTQDEIGNVDEDYNNGTSIAVWLSSAEIGDVYETQEEKITRIN
jgi:hypothetical protein